MHHYITKYTENGAMYVESWIQLNLFGKSFCFWRKRIKIHDDSARQGNWLAINSQMGSIRLNGVELELVKEISIHMDSSDLISVHLDMDVRELETDIQFDSDLKGRICWEGEKQDDEEKHCNKVSCQQC